MIWKSPHLLVICIGTNMLIMHTYNEMHRVAHGTYKETFVSIYHLSPDKAWLIHKAFGSVAIVPIAGDNESLACHSADTQKLSLHCRFNEHNGISNHRRLDCLLNRLFRRRSGTRNSLRISVTTMATSPYDKIRLHARWQKYRKGIIVNLLLLLTSCWTNIQVAGNMRHSNFHATSLQ